MNLFKEITESEILNLLKEVNLRLSEIGCHGKIILTGGAAMTLVFKARNSTRDIDAIFEPEEIIYTIIDDIAEERRLRQDWLNNDFKEFVTKDLEQELYLKLSNLTISYINAEGLLAMKLLAARPSPFKDKEDGIFLARILNIQTEEELFNIVSKYYKPEEHSPQTKTFIKLVFQEYKEKP